jgi:hypothetical protein
MSLLESIVSDLKTLPTPTLGKVSDYIHTLQPSPEERAKRVAALRSTSGCLDESEGAEFEEAVRETLNRVDTDD